MAKLQNNNKKNQENIWIAGHRIARLPRGEVVRSYGCNVSTYVELRNSSRPVVGIIRTSMSDRVGNQKSFPVGQCLDRGPGRGASWQPWPGDVVCTPLSHPNQHGVQSNDAACWVYSAQSIRYLRARTGVKSFMSACSTRYLPSGQTILCFLFWVLYTHLFL